MCDGCPYNGCRETAVSHAKSPSKFSALSSCHSECSIQVDLAEIDAMVQQFRRYACFLLTVLRGVKRKLAASPYLTNLAQLLLRIDYNNFFSNDMQPPTRTNATT